MTNPFANTPSPPYYAVIFTSRLSDTHDGYAVMGERMFERALEHPGCLGLETTRNETDGVGITVCYWKDEDSIADWKADTEHMVAQRMGIDEWYAHYELRIARVDRAYAGPDGRSAP